jgi:hypothetical protein
MKHLAYLYKIIVISLSIMLLIPQAAFADTSVAVSNNDIGSSNSVNVNSQSNGQTTTCVNGQCTTTGGGSKSTVCINGKCTSTDDGNVDYSSPDGNDQVHIHNNTGGNSVTNSPQPSAGASDVSPNPTDTPSPTITPDPTITQMRNDINNHVQKEITGVKEHMKEQNSAISDFFKTLENMLNSMFK